MIVLPSPPRVRLRRSAVIAALIGLVFATLALAAPHVLRGPLLGRVIGWVLPPMRGHADVGGGRWTWGGVWALARGRTASYVLEDVVITDPDGARVLRARRIDAAVQLDREGRGVVIHDLRVTDAWWRMAQTKDRRGIGFVAAFERPPARAASPTTGAKASGSLGGAFRIVAAQLQNLDAEFDLPGWALTLRKVHAHGSLAVQPRADGPPVFTFEVLDADVRNGGVVAVLDGAKRLVLPFSSTQIARIATPSTAPDAIELDASALRTGRSVSALHGRFTHVLGKSVPLAVPAIDLGVRIVDAADAVSAVAARHPQAAGLDVKGDGAGLAFSFRGPLAAPLIVADARNFDLQYKGLAFRATAFHLDSAPAVPSVRLTGLAFDSPAGGRVTIDGSLEQRIARGRFRFDHFDAGPFLPGPLVPFAGGTLTGHVRAESDLGKRTAGVDELDLTVTRPPHVAGPAVIHLLASAAGASAAGATARRAPGTELRLAAAQLHDGTLTLPKVTSKLWGGRVTARGQVRVWDPNTTDWMPSPRFDLSLDAARISFARLTGSGFAVGTVSLRARARGTLQALALEVTFTRRQRLRILGEWFTLPAGITAAVDTTGLTIPRLALQGQDGSALSARGHIALSGELGLEVEVLRFPLRRLPALADIDIPLDGHVQGQVRLGGSRDAPSVAGRVSIVDAHFQGRPIGGGTLTISPGVGGGIRAHGQVIEGMMADGTLVAGRGGSQGDITLTLQRLRLDPFLGWLPGGFTAAGIISGVTTAHVAPGQPPSIEGRLSELTLVVTGPSLPAPATAEGTARPTLEFHSEGEVRLAAQARTGAITLAPAHFTGRAGTLELSGETAAGAAKGRVQGRLNLNELGELAKPWIERMGGTVDFEAVASIDAAGTHPFLRGSVAVTSPVRVRLRQFPIDAGLEAGRIELTERGASTRALPVTLGRHTVFVSGQLAVGENRVPRLTLDLRGGLDPRLVEAFAHELVRQIDGKVGLTARIDGPLREPTLHARLDVGQTAFTLTDGGKRIAIPQGEITLDVNADARTAALRALEVRIGTEVRLIVGEADGQRGRLRFAKGAGLRVSAVDLPARGQVHALATPDLVVDDAAFSLRLVGDPEVQLRLAGDVEVKAAHVPEALRNRKKKAATAVTSAKPALLKLLERTQLDLRLHSQKGAISVELNHAPDLSVDLDFKVGGTIVHPRPDGRLKPSGLYSRIVMFLGGLFK